MRGSGGPTDYNSPETNPVMRRCGLVQTGPSTQPPATKLTVAVSGGQTGTSLAHRVPPAPGDDVDRYVAAVLLESLDSLAALLEGGGARVNVVEREIKVTLRSAPSPPSQLISHTPSTPPPLPSPGPPSSPVDSLDEVPSLRAAYPPEAFFIRLSDEEQKPADGGVADLMPEKLKRRLRRRQHRREVRAERARRARDDNQAATPTSRSHRFRRKSEIRTGHDRVEIVARVKQVDEQQSGVERHQVRMRPSRIPVPVRPTPPPCQRRTFATIPEEGSDAGSSPRRALASSGGGTSPSVSADGAMACGWSLTLSGSGVVPPARLEVRMQFAHTPPAPRAGPRCIRAPPPLSVQGKALPSAAPTACRTGYTTNAASAAPPVVANQRCSHQHHLDNKA